MELRLIGAAWDRGELASASELKPCSKRCILRKPQEMSRCLSLCVKPRMAQVAAATACVGWMAVSSGLIMLNKHLMSTDGFHFPMALSCLGMLFSSVASHFCCRVQPIPSLCYLLVSPTFPPCEFGMALSLKQVIKVVDVKRTLTWKFYIMRILPVGFFMALTLHFGNTVYLYLTVSFIQMLKARIARCQAHMNM